MQKGRTLHFSCLSCQEPIHFSIFDLEKVKWTLACPSCQKTYALQDEVLMRQLRKFEALCLQLLESEEILSNTAVGIRVGENDVLIPFKILLTRLNSHLDLTMGGHPLRISFRIEPAKDTHSHHQQKRNT